MAILFVSSTNFMMQRNYFINFSLADENSFLKFLHVPCASIIAQTALYLPRIDRKRMNRVIKRLLTLISTWWNAYCCSERFQVLLEVQSESSLQAQKSERSVQAQARPYPSENTFMFAKKMSNLDSRIIFGHIVSLVCLDARSTNSKLISVI